MATKPHLVHSSKLVPPDQLDPNTIPDGPHCVPPHPDDVATAKANANASSAPAKKAAPVKRRKKAPTARR